jgi:O-acetylserine/cysteine efflux transporter
MPRRHAVLALVVAVCWAVNFVVIDIGLETFPPLLFAALRFGLVALPAVFLVPRPDVRWRVVVAVGLFICVGQFGLLFVAMNIGLPAGLASVIAPLQPVFTIPFAVVALGERPSPRQVAGVCVALAGLGVIAAGRAHGVPFVAVALGVASAASWGAGNVVTRSAGAKRPFSLLVWSSLVAPVPLLGLSLIFEGTGRWERAASSVHASGVMALAYVVIVSTFFGYGVWYRLMSRYPASTVAPFTLLVPVVGIITAWLVRNERPTWGELAGSFVALIGLGLALGLGRCVGDSCSCSPHGEPIRTDVNMSRIGRRSRRPSEGCVRSRLMISIRLDGELSDWHTAWLAAHLRHCAACVTYAAALCDLVDRIRSSPLEQSDTVISPPRRSAHSRTRPAQRS